MSTAKKCFPATGKETPSFAMTCNRLSSFLKEKRNIKDQGINEKCDVKGKPSISSSSTQKNTTTVDYLSSIESMIQTSTKTDKSTNKAASSEPVATMDSKTSQMTIFYSGRVLVFDSVSVNKARELMLVARGTSNSGKQIQNRIQSASTSTSVSQCEAFGSQVQIHPGLQVNESDLPIARRASLHRFLAKRKHRATVRAPYQLHNPLVAAASSNHEFDLNL